MTIQLGWMRTAIPAKRPICHPPPMELSVAEPFAGPGDGDRRRAWASPGAASRAN